MAKIVENSKGRRSIRLSSDDVITIVREYQNTITTANSYENIRKKLEEKEFYLPEDYS